MISALGVAVASAWWIVSRVRGLSWMRGHARGCQVLRTLQVTAESLARLVVEKEEFLSHHLAGHAASNVVAVASSMPAFVIWIRPEKKQRLLSLALQSKKRDIINAVASWSILKLRGYPDVVEHLAGNYDLLAAEPRRNFLAASYNVDFSGKEGSLLLRVSADRDLDDLSLEAVVVGLSNCSSATAFQRVVEVANSQHVESRIGAVVRGIALGAKRDRLSEFAKVKWASRLVQVGIEIIVKASQKHAPSDPPEGEYPESSPY